MKEFVYTIKDPLGVHARPASKLFMEAVKYQCTVRAECNSCESDVKNILDIMGMNAVLGSSVRFVFDGPDEEEAMKAMQEVVDQSM